MPADAHFAGDQFRREAFLQIQLNRFASDLKRMRVNVRVNRPRRAAPLGGRVFFLFPGTSLIPSIGNTPFGSTWEPTRWSVTPFPMELRPAIWLLAQ